jgi:hypothetical protein
MFDMVFAIVLTLLSLVFGGMSFRYSFPRAATSYYPEITSQSRKKVYPGFFNNGSFLLSWLLHLPSTSRKGKHWMRLRWIYRD